MSYLTRMAALAALITFLIWPAGAIASDGSAMDLNGTTMTDNASWADSGMAQPLPYNASQTDLSYVVSPVSAADFIPMAIHGAEAPYPMVIPIDVIRVAVLRGDSTTERVVPVATMTSAFFYEVTATDYGGPELVMIEVWDDDILLQTQLRSIYDANRWLPDWLGDHGVDVRMWSSWPRSGEYDLVVDQGGEHAAFGAGLHFSTDELLFALQMDSGGGTSSVLGDSAIKDGDAYFLAEELQPSMSALR